MAPHAVTPNPSLKRTVTGMPSPGTISFLPGAVLPAPAD